MNSSFFKICPLCQTAWKSKKDFIKDPDIVLQGYQVDFEALEYGLFLFNHMLEICKSTIAIEVSDFMYLYSGKRFPELKTGSTDCPLHCRQEDNLERCQVECEASVVREIIHIIKLAKRVDS